MATIKISDLRPAGSDFFMDSESYLNELTDEELSLTHGGSTPWCIALGVTIAVTVCSCAWQLSIYLGRKLGC
ncbi:MAG: hypothetical protein PUP90_02920 [Nostoc sp. S4]|nr:hypothetical protein [Nostoc sp. S4]